MKKIVNMCRGCATDSYPCRGLLCPNQRVPVYYCDKCGCEIDDDVFDVDGEDLCEDCLKEKFRKEV